jgi:hypothetical protein
MSLLLTLCLMFAPPSAAELVERSIQYHDPQDRWRNTVVDLVAVVELAPRLASERGYAKRIDHLQFDLKNEIFSVESNRGEQTFRISTNAGSYSVSLNGSTEIDAERREELGLQQDRLPRWHHYFEYMFGLPMKLRDPGTRIEPTVTTLMFNGSEVWAVRVTYDPKVGSDVWDFFFDPKNAALVGCRFFHDEAKNDGEQIAFSEEIVGSGGMRLPKVRSWHMNEDGEWIANDEIESLN